MAEGENHSRFSFEGGESRLRGSFSVCLSMLEYHNQTRRSFLAKAAAGAAALANLEVLTLNVHASAGKAAPSAPEPWYRRAVRWGQTNITEREPGRYDIAWWRGYCSAAKCAAPGRSNGSTSWSSAS